MPVNGVGPSASVLALAALLAAVVVARRQLEEQRAVDGIQWNDGRAARGELLGALESYAAGLSAANRPVPYRLRDELRINRALRRLW